MGAVPRRRPARQRNRGLNPIERPGARVVVLDDELRVLLLCYTDEQTGEPRWIPPGGALEADETHEQAARRELFEEVGLVDAVVSPCNWTRDIVWEWMGVTYRSREQWFITRVPCAFEVESPGLVEHEVIAGWRWWTLDEVAEGVVDGVDIRPRRLAGAVRSLLDAGAPPSPVDIGN